jgi:short chain dehydrogenase
MTSGCCTSHRLESDTGVLRDLRMAPMRARKMRLVARVGRRGGVATADARQHQSRFSERTSMSRQTASLPSVDPERVRRPAGQFPYAGIARIRLWGSPSGFSAFWPLRSPQLTGRPLPPASQAYRNSTRTSCSGVGPKVPSSGIGSDCAPSPMVVRRTSSARRARSRNSWRRWSEPRRYVCDGCWKVGSATAELHESLLPGSMCRWTLSARFHLALYWPVNRGGNDGSARKTAIITGAARGIGAAIAKSLVAEGINVVITGSSRSWIVRHPAQVDDGGPVNSAGGWRSQRGPVRRRPLPRRVLAGC